MDQKLKKRLISSIIILYLYIIPDVTITIASLLRCPLLNVEHDNCESYVSSVVPSQVENLTVSFSEDPSLLQHTILQLSWTPPRGELLSSHYFHQKLKEKTFLNLAYNYNMGLCIRRLYHECRRVFIRSCSKVTIKLRLAHLHVVQSTKRPH